MILMLAKDALKTKVKFDTAIMTGNYECAYALGLVTGYCNVKKCESYNDISTLKEQVMLNVTETSFTDDRLKRLYEMLVEYEPSEKFDNQMKELYDMGIEEYKVF